MKSSAILLACLAVAAPSTLAATVPGGNRWRPVNRLFLAHPERRQAATPPTPPAGPQGKVIPVTVGSPTREKSVRFYPDNIKAAVGDVIQFQFWPNNHTVTQSAGVAAPCEPMKVAQGTEPAINSGFIFGAKDGSPVGTFSMQVKTTEPVFLYCATNPHCNLGMVAVINGKTDQDVEQLRTAAMAINSTIYGDIPVSGGQVGQIPMTQAVPPPTR